MAWGRGVSFALGIVAAEMLLVAPALAQQGAGVLTGRVLDANGNAPIEDVVVTVTSVALQGEQIVVTDASGHYRIPNLPPGLYTMRLEKEAYRPYSRSDVALRADSTIRVDVLLLPEALTSEAVVVIGHAPTVDVGSSSTGVNIGTDFTSRVPVAAPAGRGGGQRSFEAVAEVTPGARTDDYGVSISGTTSPENQYVVDGVSVNNPAFGINGSPLSIDFVKEVNVITGGYMPEYGRATGGVLNVITKSGSNEFHGSAWGYMSPGDWEGPRHPIKRQGSSIVTEPSLGSVGDFGADLGGPIVKDKLWFYAGVDVSHTAFNLDRSLERVLVDSAGKPLTDATGLEVRERMPGTERRYVATGQALQTYGKLTYTINPDHRLTLTFGYAPSSSGGKGAFGIDPQTGVPEVNNIGVGGIVGTYDGLAHRYEQNALDSALKWTAEFDNKRLLIDTLVGWHNETGGTYASDGTGPNDDGSLAKTPQVRYRRNPALHPITDFESIPDPSLCEPAGTATAVRCPVPTYVLGGPGYVDQRALNRYQARSVVTYLKEALGHHIFKAGVDVDVSTYDHTRSQHILKEDSSGAFYADYRQYGYLTSPTGNVFLSNLHSKSQSIESGAFVQDSWSVLDKITLNVGARYDAQFLYGDQNKLGLSLPNEISPRVGAIFDPTQSGHAKLFANFAMFYESVPLDMADRSLSPEPWLVANHSAAACNPAIPSQAANQCQQSSALLTQTGSRSGPERKWSLQAAGREPIDPNIRPQSSGELVFGGEYDLFKNGRVGVSYTKRWLNNVIEDMSTDESLTYFIGNPGHGIAKSFPTAQRDYDAATVYLMKAFADDWLAQVSYTVSYLRGNYSGLYRPETGQLDPNIGQDFDLVSLLVNRVGPLPGDHTHDIKVYGSKDFILPHAMFLTLGGAFKARSGEPTNFLGSHPLYGADAVFILPRGSGDRLPWAFDIDTHFGFGVDLERGRRLMVTLDVFNLFNFQEVTATDQTYTTADVLPVVNGTRSMLPGALRAADGSALDPRTRNANFGQPTTYQPPRTFRMGIKTTF